MEPSKGLLETIRDHGTKEFSIMYPGDMLKSLDEISKRPVKPFIPEFILSVWDLRSTHAVLGKRKFSVMLKSIRVLTGMEGLKFIESLGIPPE